VVSVLSPKPGEIQGVRHGVGKTVRVKVDRTLKDVRTGEFDDER